MTTLFVALLALAGLAWLIGRGRRKSARPADRSESIDRDVLEQAEEEVRGLGTFATPDEAEDELPDWGPGAPRH